MATHNEPTHIHCDDCAREGCTGVAKTAQPPKEPSPEWLIRAREEGRAEFLRVLLDESPEDFESLYIGSHPIADTGDYGSHWEESRLRELFKVGGDVAFSYIDNIDATYWSQMAKIGALEAQLEEFRTLSSGKVIDVVKDHITRHVDEEQVLSPTPHVDFDEINRLKVLEANVINVLDGLGSFAVRMREGGGPEDLAMSLAVSVVKLEREVKRLKDQINTPEIADFLHAVKMEAAHQRERWGVEHDQGKADTDWIFLIGFLGGKAVQAGKTAELDGGDMDMIRSRHNEKRLHHIITAAAACMNWWMHAVGADTRMRPGIAGESVTETVQRGLVSAEQIRIEEGYKEGFSPDQVDKAFSLGRVREIATELTKLHMSDPDKLAEPHAEKFNSLMRDASLALFTAANVLDWDKKADAGSAP